MSDVVQLCGDSLDEIAHNVPCNFVENQEISQMQIQIFLRINAKTNVFNCGKIK